MNSRRHRQTVKLNKIRHTEYGRPKREVLLTNLGEALGLAKRVVESEDFKTGS